MIYCITLEESGWCEDLFGEILLIEGDNLSSAKEAFDKWVVESYGLRGFGSSRYEPPKKPTVEELWATVRQVKLPLQFFVVGQD